MTALSRFLRVARMLLRIQLRVAQLCALVLMSACVLPIGPDFQDPLASPNYAPVFIDTLPAFGMSATATPQVLATFQVGLSDPNVGDNLTVRWIVDFPPFTSNTRPQQDVLLTHNANGTPLDQLVSFTPSCVQTALAKIPVHQIMVVVSDRGFVAAKDPTDLTSVPTGGLTSTANWNLNLECP